MTLSDSEEERGRAEKVKRTKLKSNTQKKRQNQHRNSLDTKLFFFSSLFLRTLPSVFLILLSAPFYALPIFSAQFILFSYPLPLSLHPYCVSASPLVMPDTHSSWLSARGGEFFPLTFPYFPFYFHLCSLTSELYSQPGMSVHLPCWTHKS